jgi:mRNA interferase MazF
VKRGEIWWASLAAPSGSGSGSEPGYRRPVVIVSSNEFNDSRIQTVLAAVITSNLRLAAAPGNLALPRKHSKLNRESVINVSQLLTIDKQCLGEKVCRLATPVMQKLDHGLNLVLGLS